MNNLMKHLALSLVFNVCMYESSSKYSKKSDSSSNLSLIKFEYNRVFCEELNRLTFER